MEHEITLSDIYEQNADLLALCRTKWAMGETQESMHLYEEAALQYDKFKDILKDYPGFHALQHAHMVTLRMFSADQNIVSVKPRKSTRNRKKR